MQRELADEELELRVIIANAVADASKSFNEDVRARKLTIATGIDKVRRDVRPQQLGSRRDLGRFLDRARTRRCVFSVYFAGARSTTFFPTAFSASVASPLREISIVITVPPLSICSSRCFSLYQQAISPSPATCSFLAQSPR